jgi:hypothetical protein
MKRKRRKMLKPAVRMTLMADRVMGDRRTKRKRTRSQAKVQFKKELAGGGQ